MMDGNRDAEDEEMESAIEVIVRLNRVIRDWWNELPRHLRLCDDLYATNAMEITKRNTSVVKTIVFSFVHSILLKMWIYLLNSSEDTIVTPIKEPVNDGSSIFCRKTQVDSSIRSCELLLSSVIRLFHLHDDIVPCKIFLVYIEIYHLCQGQYIYEDDN